MTDVSQSVRARGVDRRSVLMAGAWAAPVIVIAAAVPAASASSHWDLALEPAQRGDSVPLFNAALTERYTVPSPSGIIIANRGADASPAGAITITLQVDDRVWSVEGMEYGIVGGGDASDAGAGSKTVTGNVASYSWTIALSVAAGANWESDGIDIRPRASFLGAYPDDHLDDVAPITWILTPPAGDADASNNVSAWTAQSEPVPASPFGGVIGATWSGVVVADSHTTYRPTTVTLFSVGPNEILAGDAIAVTVEAQATDEVALAGTPTIDGTPIAGLLTMTGPIFFGRHRQTLFTLEQPIPAGTTLRFEIAYAGPATVIEPYEGQNAWVTYVTSPANPPDQRAIEQAQVLEESTPL